MPAYDDFIIKHPNCKYYWNLDGSIYATKGNVNLTGTTTFGTGKIHSQCATFDGVSQELHTASNISFVGSNKVSVAMWCKPIAYNIANPKILFELSNNANLNTDAFAFSTSGDLAGDPMNMFHKGDVGYMSFLYNKATFPINNGTWYFIVCVYDKASVSEGKLYINGILQTPDTIDVDSNNTNGFGSYVFYLGSRAGSSLFQNWAVDGLAMFDTVLTQDEISTLYSAGGYELKTPAPVVYSGPQNTYDKIVISNPNCKYYWNMDGSIYANKGGVNLTGTTTFAAGKIHSQCATFNGVNEELHTASNIDLSDTVSVTVSGWFKWIAYDKTNVEFLFSHNPVANQRFQCYTLGNVAGDPITPILTGDVGNSQMYYTVPATVALDDGGWHHIAFLFDKTKSSGETSMYVDGVLVTPSSVVTDLNNTNTFGTAVFYLGTSDGSTGYTNIAVDGLAIFNKALTNDEIKELYSAGGYELQTPTPVIYSGSQNEYDEIILSHPNCKYYWTLDGTVANSKGGINLTGTTTFDCGKIHSKCATFDGVSQELHTASNLTFPGAEKISVAFWWYPTTYDLTNLEVVYEYSPIIDTNNNAFALATRGDLANDVLRVAHSDVAASSQYSIADYNNATFSFSTPQWFFIVATYDKTLSTNEANLYINGVLATASSRPTNFNCIDGFSDYVLYLCSRAGSTNFANHKLDGFSIFDTILTQDEINNIYNASNVSKNRGRQTLLKSSTGQVTPSGIAGRLYGYELSIGTIDSSAIFSDGSGGTNLWKVSYNGQVAAGDVVKRFRFKKPIIFSNDIYVTLAGTGATIWVDYEPIE